MARKKPTSSTNADATPQVVRAAGALMLIGEPVGAAGARSAMTAACEAVIVLRKVAELLEASATCDVLVLCAPHDCPQLRDALDAVHRQRPGVACVVWCDAPTIELASACLQLGAADLIDNTSALEAPARLAKAIRRTRQWRAARRLRATRAKELRDAGKQLASLRGELEKQVGVVAGQLAGGFRDVAGQLKYVAVATELETLLRQELEVEPLLRTTLEFLLRKVGAVNAAIFMPDDGRLLAGRVREL
jgi:hypothetical protein